MDRRSAALIILSWVLAPIVAFGAAAAYVQQGGLVTNGHVVSWTQSGIIQDGGTSVTGNINTLGITSPSGTPFCITTAKNPSPRVQFCMGLSSTAAQFVVNSYGGAAAVPFEIVINGVTYEFPSDNPGLGALRIVASGATDTATSFDGTVSWNSSVTSAKTETLYACSAGAKGNALYIKDQVGTASTYPITVNAAGSDTIDGSSSYVIAFSGGFVSLQCNGAGVWLVL